MNENKTVEGRSRRRFQIILFVSVLVPCALLGYLAVHVLHDRETQMIQMARSRSRATARMAVTAAEKAIRAQADEFLMGFMKAALQPTVTPHQALEKYLAQRPLAMAAFVFDYKGNVLGRSLATGRQLPEALRGDSPLVRQIYRRIRTRISQGRTDFLFEQAAEAGLLISYTGLGKPADDASGILAAILDGKWLRDNVVRPILSAQSRSSGLRLNLKGSGGALRHARVTASASFPQDLPLGTVEVSGLDETLRQSVRRDRFLLGAGLALVYGVVGAGVFFSWRVFRREWELNRMKSAFLANVSHELRTPLALIRMYAESLMLGRVADEEKRTEYHQVLVRETGRLTHLINNVLDFSDIESNRIRFEFRTASLPGLVRRVLTDYGPQMEQAGTTIESHISDDLPDIPLDEGAMTQAVLNLLDNAAKFSTGPPEVRVRVYANGDLFLEVEDHGPGIPPEQRARIFEPFYRANPGIAPKGSGLGLAVVRHVVEAHGGSVHAEAGGAGGSRFVIRFPRDRTHSEEPQKETRP